MKISPEKIREILEANPILEVLSEYLDLKKVGKQYRCLCPFHHDTKPSFYVSPDKGLFHCFGCGKSGNVIHFLMEYKGMTFVEAVRYLAERRGIKLTWEPSENRRLYELCEFAAKFYHNLLFSKDGMLARKYLEKRGVSQEIIEEFKIGYAPASGNVFFEIARDEGFSPEEIEKAGLAINADGEYIDKFRGRVMFPIKDAYGKIIGFGGRVLDDREPKYMNSPETPIFKKNQTLYGLDIAKEYIRREDYAILVEGYMDLISLHQYGIKNVVASLGTSLTEGQAQLLSRYTKNVYIFYDADESGKKAADRAIDVLLKAGIYPKILLPEEGDPDEFIRKEGKEGFEKLLKKELDFIDFRISKCDTLERKLQISHRFAETLSQIPEGIQKEILKKEIAERLGIPENALTITRYIPERKKGNIKIDPVEEIEIKMLAIAARAENLCNLIKNKFTSNNEKIMEIAEKVFSGMKPEELVNELEEDKRNIFIKAMFEDKMKEDEEVLNQLIERKEEFLNRKRCEEIKKLIREKEAKGEEIPLELLLELNRLRKKREGNYG